MAKSTKRKVNRTRGNDLKRTVRRGKKSNRVSSKKRSSKRGKTKQMGGAFGNKKEVIDASELNILVKRLNRKMDLEEQAKEEQAKEEKVAKNVQYANNDTYMGLEPYNPNKMEILYDSNEKKKPTDADESAPEPPPRTRSPESTVYEQPDPTASITNGNAGNNKSEYGFESVPEGEDGEAYGTGATSPLSEAVVRDVKNANEGKGKGNGN